MLKVEVTSEEVAVKSGTAAKTGRPYSIREQEAWITFYDRNGKPNPYPSKVRLSLEEGVAPYKAGQYVIAPESLYPDRFGQVSIRAVLRPVQVTAARAA